MLQWQTLDKETPMHRKLHNRMFTYVAAAATVAVAAAMIAVGAPAASAAPRTIAVVGKITGFGTPTINVKAGEQVSICLTSPDMPHDLTISDLNFKVASTGPSTCKTLTAPAAAGSHPFICSVQGHSGTMKGSLVVGAAAGAAPAAAAPAAAAPAAGAPQVAVVPAGGVQTGGGSTAGLTHVNLLTLGGGLLVAAMMSVLLGTRVARKN
jgi:heme/copper-type cytochrome/quinol oxidase subunit 2